MQEGTVLQSPLLSYGLCAEIPTMILIRVTVGCFHYKAERRIDYSVLK